MSGESCPNCHKCENFQTSWDPKAPYSCRQFGFKCRTLPSLEVLATTGKHCIFYRDKTPLGGTPSSSYRPVQVLPDNCTFSISA